MDDAEAHRPTVFERILCGVDGTPESLVAVRQAVRLQGPDGSLYLRSVAHLAKAAHAGFGAPRAAALLQDEAEAALAEARAIAPSADGKVVDGEPVAVLLREIDAERATLVAVGSHGRGRAAGMLLGTVAARMLRDAPCSVLIAREAREPDAWPQAVVVGIDGSRVSAAAYMVARLVAERFGASLRAVSATIDHIDSAAAHAIAPDLEDHAEPAAELLAAASHAAHLVVVGSRGLRVLKALGSVSERVAHQARASALVVQPSS